MPTRPVKMLDGETISLPDETIDQLRANLQGSLVTPENDAYEAARKVWNGISAQSVPAQSEHPACSMSD
ncbi:MAG: hypothetical protein GC204_13860 [Chloroflexi bacterium]|nr:hypothetical protein [Chloroflexota bacterium]